jgi:hypothetical protein
VVVGLVPALEEDLGGRALDLEQAHDLGVVGAGEVKVGHAHVHVRQAEDPHVRSLLGPLGRRYEVSRSAG